MKKNILIALLFIVLVAAATYPLIFKVTTHIPGFFSSDESYAPIWDSWRIKYSFSHGISLSHTPFIAHPIGMDVYGQGLVSYLWFAWFWILSIYTTPILTYNILVLMNMYLSGVIVYFLIFYLTKARLAGIAGGIAFAFCPYQFARSWQHLSLTFNELIPLIIFAAILLRDRNSRETKVVFLASLLLLFSFDWSIMYLGGMALAVFLFYVLSVNWRVKYFKDRSLLSGDIGYLKRIVAIGAITSVILMAQILPVVIKSIKLSSTTPSSGFNTYHRPFQDLFTQSAKPLSYLLPATTHPVFGKFTEQFMGSPLYGISYTEHALYLGWVPLILAFIALRRWRRDRKAHRLSEKDRYYIGFFAFLALVAWMLSQPPYFTFPYFKIYMPSFFLYKILPMFRAYCRFGIVLMFAVSVLAGYGLKFILEKFYWGRVKVGITSLMCCLVLFEFLNFPPYKVINLMKYPRVYDWLKLQKKAIAIAEYPLDLEGCNEYYKFCQTIHEKRMINGTTPGTTANALSQKIRSLAGPETAQTLRSMGVRYVLVHRRPYETSNDVIFTEEFDLIKDRKIRGLQFLGCVDNIDLYEVRAGQK